ncbi:MAG: aldehyde dehydrogenase family protein [Legionella sp.]|nr:aldehyde dehydrogenase family protein [Legionella sp.]
MNINKLFTTQKQAYIDYPLSTAEERIADLEKLKTHIIEKRENLFEAVHKDFNGKCIDEVFITEIIPIIESIKYIVKNIHEWMKPSIRHVNPYFGKINSWVLYQPLGVVGIVSSWNYPIYLTLNPLVYALSAGNRVMIKTSDLTKNTSAVLRELLALVFQNEQVCIIPEQKNDIMEFSKLAFDHLFFTGSSKLGKHIMKNASEKLTPLTLELGGKSPAIIADTAEIESAIEKIIYAKTVNSGQTCIAPDYLLVHTDLLKTVIRSTYSVFDKFYNDFAHNSQYGNIINEEHYQRLLGYIEDAREKGAEILTLGEMTSVVSNRKLPLVIVLHVKMSMKVMQEEIFGPILPIITYNDFDEVITILNQKESPLAIYYFGKNEEQINKLSVNTRSGSLCINDAMIQFVIDDLPFGGVGNSGFGRYHAKEGFINFSNTRSVISNVDSKISHRLQPPYNGIIVKSFEKYIA